MFARGGYRIVCGDASIHVGSVNNYNYELLSHSLNNHYSPVY